MSKFVDVGITPYYDIFFKNRPCNNDIEIKAGREDFLKRP